MFEAFLQLRFQSGVFPGFDRILPEIITEYAGPITVSGIGAGGIETASAILSDLIDIMDERIGD